MFAPSLRVRHQTLHSQRQTNNTSLIKRDVLFHCVCVSSDSVPLRIERTLSQKYNEKAIRRVLDAWRRIGRGEVFKDKHREAHSYMEDLLTKPFFNSSELPWAKELEKRSQSIREELQSWAGSEDELARRGTNVWVPAAREEGSAYGPEWRTLVLQDRVWDDRNCKLFPVTTRIVRDELDIPSVEIFFARQDRGTGIQLHSDGCNFILTTHLALSVPEGKSWIEVAGNRRFWENGKILTMDTSFFHRTFNESTDMDRIVLIIRHWHPDTSLLEREALRFIFLALEDEKVLDQ